jgi:hypothetical protein
MRFPWKKAFVSGDLPAGQFENMLNLLVESNPISQLSDDCVRNPATVVLKPQYFAGCG